MSLLQQLVQFLSQPPESLVYHLVTLLALQATFWLALWQVRRRPADSFARRLVWASGGIIIGRLLILFASLSVANPAEAGLLPPLERAIDTATVVLIVWALAPQFPNQPRLGNVIALILLIMTGFIFAFFAQEWMAMIDAGAQPDGYAITNQAELWEIIQMIVLGIGSLLILFGREDEWVLRLAVVSILFFAHTLSLIFLSGDTAVTTNIAYWVRLGNLIAFPTLAILTYRHNLRALLPARGFEGSDLEDLANLLDLAQKTIGHEDLDTVIGFFLKMAATSISAEYVAISIKLDVETNRYHLFHIEKETAGDGTEDVFEIYRDASFDLSSYPAFRKSIEKSQQVELFPDGQGAKQLNEFYKAIKVKKLGSLLIQPLYVNNDDIGLLLLAGPVGRAKWPAPEKKLAISLSKFIARVILDAREQESTTNTASKKVGDREMTTDPNERVRELEEELAAESQRVEQLIAALALAEEINRGDRVKKLEEEVETLREALIEAEEAMAMAAATDAGVSTDWVMRTVSRYSGELEEAQLQINELEAQVSILSKLSDLGSFSTVARELRTPLTTLGVYTDLLMSESLGLLGNQQMSVLKKMKTGIDNMSSSLDEMISKTETIPSPLVDREMVDVRETIEAAIGTVSDQMQAKRLKLDLIVDEDLPRVPSYDDAFYQIVAHLLNSACLLSIQEGRVSIVAQHDIFPISGASGEDVRNSYLHLTVSDNGADKSNKLHAKLFAGLPFDEQEPVDNYISMATKDLKTVKELVDGFGGRTWVEHETDIGGKVSVLLPITINGNSETG